MANVKITDLGAYTDPVSTDVLPIVDVGADITKKVSIADLLENAGSGTAAAPGIAFDGDSDTGIYRPGANQVAISTNGTGRLFVDASGNVGVGTQTPSNKLQVEGTGSVRSSTIATDASGDAAFFVQNDNSSLAGPLTYGTTKAAYGALGSGETAFYSNRDTTIMADGSSSRVIKFASGGNSEKMRLDGSGTFRVKGAGTAGVNDAVQLNGSAPANSLLLDASGRVLVGTPTSISFNGVPSPLQIQGATDATSRISIRRTSNDASPGVLVFGKSRSSGHALLGDGDTIGQFEFYGADGNDTNQRAGLIACQVDGTPGTNDMPGRLVFSTTADGASSPTERMRITSDGSVSCGEASNLDGFSVSSSTATGSRFSLAGQGIHFANEATCLFLSRQGDDGQLVSLRQAGVEEGSITVSGTTVSYNGAHLSRWSQLVGIDPYDKTTRPEILRGTVMSNLDEMCDWTCPTSGDCQDNEQLNKTEISSVDDDPNVAGVFQAWDDDDDTWVNDFYLAMTGDFVIRIAAGTTVQRGDLLCSAGDGTARPQGDRYLKDSTIAKVTSTAVSCTHPDGSYCVPCVLMAC